MDAAAAILCAAVEGSQVDIDTAFEIETQWFVQLATSPQTRNIIQGTFFDMQTVRSGASRPEGFEPWQATRVAVLGAGMMGAGIALNAATSGMIVHLKDVDQAAAERGKAYAVKVLDKDVARGRRSQEQANAIAALIQPTTDVTDLAGADLLIEAVFEDPALKLPCWPRSWTYWLPTRCSRPTPPPCRSPDSRERGPARGFHRPPLLQPGRADGPARDRRG